MRYHFMPVRMAAIQKSTSNKCWRGCGENGTFLHCWWECKLAQPLVRTVWRFLKKLEMELPSIQFSSVAQSCPTLYDPMNCSTPGLPVHHQFPEFTQSQVLRVHDAIQPSHPLSSPSPCPQSLPASESFPLSQFFAWGGQSIGVSTSISVLPMNTQDWSPLGWTSWISLQSKGLSRVFSNATVQKHQLFGTQLSL